MHLAFTIRRSISNSSSDATDVDFGVRKITYSVPGTDTLTISVNGVPIFIRGGDWGLDEAMKRIPRERLDAEIHMSSTRASQHDPQLGGPEHGRGFLRTV